MITQEAKSNGVWYLPARGQYTQQMRRSTRGATLAKQPTNEKQVDRHDEGELDGSRHWSRGGAVSENKSHDTNEKERHESQEPRDTTDSTFESRPGQGRETKRVQPGAVNFTGDESRCLSFQVNHFYASV